MKITPIILSGGSGTRLWPVSRSLNPKQFSDFFGKNTLFQRTALRVHKDHVFGDPVIICNNEHRFIVAEELHKAKISPSSIILEPIARNTAPAVAIAALDVIAKLGKEDDLMLVMPSDHIIRDEKEFVSCVKKAASAAFDGYLVTFGIVPNRAETGFGYIEKSKALSNFSEVFAVKQFIEKPKKEIAEKFFQGKKHFWNSGIFLFRASVYLEALRDLQHNIFISCCNAYSNSIKDLDFVRLSLEDFEKSENISIDYAIMEKAEKTAVVPMDAGWSDVGSWQAVTEISDIDENGNSLFGDVAVLDTKNCYINSSDKMISTIGVENLVIIATKDVVLVADKNSTQQVKTLFETLKKQKRVECDSHTKVMRPWGSFETIELSDRFKVKKIIVKSGAALSLQMHHHRAEHWIVVRGTANVICDDKEFVLTEDESTYIPVGKRHRLENKGQIPLEIIEVQTGSYLGEDDIVRFSDIYGR